MSSKSIYLRLAALAFLSLLTFKVEAATVRCTHFSCQQDQLATRTLTTQEVTSLPADTLSQLQSKAEELASIWSDTILEGDYYAEEKVQLDQVDVLFRSGQLVGYHITYSSTAWDTSTCSFDGNDMSSLNACEKGRIVESGFTTVDFKALERDPKAFASFQKD
jgi:hypothetical protein